MCADVYSNPEWDEQVSTWEGEEMAGVTGSTVLLLAFAAAHAAAGAGWEAVQRIAPDQKVKVGLCAGKTVGGEFVSASGAAVVVRSDSGEQSFARQDVCAMKVADNGRRIRNGMIWTGVGAGAGAGIGFAICPGCANEGAGGKYTAPMAAAGAGLGAIAGFLRPAYRTIYRVPPGK